MVQEAQALALQISKSLLPFHWVSLRTQYVDAGLKNVSLSNFHGVAVRNATIYVK